MRHSCRKKGDDISFMVLSTVTLGYCETEHVDSFKPCCHWGKLIKKYRRNERCLTKPLLGLPRRSLSITSLSPLWKQQTHSSNCTDINCLVAINIHQAFVDVDTQHFFCIEELNYTSMFLTDINYDRNCFL